MTLPRAFAYLWLWMLGSIPHSNAEDNCASEFNPSATNRPLQRTVHPRYVAQARVAGIAVREWMTTEKRIPMFPMAEGGRGKRVAEMTDAERLERHLHDRLLRFGGTRAEALEDPRTAAFMSELTSEQQVVIYAYFERMRMPIAVKA